MVREFGYQPNGLDHAQQFQPFPLRNSAQTYSVPNAQNCFANVASFSVWFAVWRDLVPWSTVKCFWLIGLNQISWSPLPCLTLWQPARNSSQSTPDKIPPRLRARAGWRPVKCVRPGNAQAVRSGRRNSHLPPAGRRWRRLPSVQAFHDWWPRCSDPRCPHYGLPRPAPLHPIRRAPKSNLCPSHALQKLRCH